MPLEEYTRNLETIISHIQSSGAEHILLLTPPPLHEPARVKHNQEVRTSFSNAVAVQTSRQLHALAVKLCM